MFQIPISKTSWRIPNLAVAKKNENFEIAIDRNNSYQSIIFWHRLNKVQNVFSRAPHILAKELDLHDCWHEAEIYRDR